MEDGPPDEGGFTGLRAHRQLGPRLHLRGVSAQMRPHSGEPLLADTAACLPSRARNLVSWPRRAAVASLSEAVFASSQR